MSIIGQTGRAVKGYFSIIYGSARGALGVEAARQTGQVTSAAVTKLRRSTCPRCLEQSLVRTREERGVMLTCQRADICGYRADPADVENLRSTARLDPRVIALAKGFAGSFEERASGAMWVSRMLWAMALLIFIYGLYWAAMGQVITTIWTMMVTIICGLQAIRYAYMARRLSQGGLQSAREFLKDPGQWLV